jgi:hypothetical protein
MSGDGGATRLPWENVPGTYHLSVDEQLDEATVMHEVDRLVDEVRVSCLWFLRPDYRPATTAERVRILQLIERHADRATYQRAATLRRCLSPTSSDASAAS